MQLKIAIGGHVIASLLLNEKKAGSLEYIYAKRCQLAEACADVIASQKERPIYFIDVPSKMSHWPIS